MEAEAGASNDPLARWGLLCSGAQLLGYGRQTLIGWNGAGDAFRQRQAGHLKMSMAVDETRNNGLAGSVEDRRSSGEIPNLLV